MARRCLAQVNFDSKAMNFGITAMLNVMIRNGAYPRNKSYKMSAVCPGGTASFTLVSLVSCSGLVLGLTNTCILDNTPSPLSTHIYSKCNECGMARDL